MTATHTRRRKITRQRLTTDDENAAKALQDKLMIEMIRALCGDENDKSGILRGCTVSVVAATMNVAVNPGLGLLFDSTSVSPDSRYQVLEVVSTLTLTLDAADPALPRWDLIEIQPASTNGTAEVIDFWDPTLGTFVSAPASPLQVSAPVLGFVKGTPNASPKLPTPTAGYIPLAYQYVPAAVASLDPDDTWHCRPILTPRGDHLDPSRYAPAGVGRCVGGGVQLDDGAATGTVANDFQGYFRKSHTPFRLPRGTDIKCHFGGYDGGGLPATDIPVYFYAIPVPFPKPAGDPNILAPRESYIVNSADIQSGGVADGQIGCMIISSPWGPDVNAQGNPGAGGTGSFTGHPTFDAFTSTRSGWVYLGAGFWDSGTPGFVGQETFGDRVDTYRKPGYDLTGDLPIVATTYFKVTEEVAGEDPIEYPPHAFDVSMGVVADVAGGSQAKLVFGGTTDEPAGALNYRAWGCYEAGNLANTINGGQFLINPDASTGRIYAAYANSDDGAATMVVRCFGYRDRILAMR